jgi:hypothetical protein
MKILELIKNKFNRFNKKMDDYQEVITFSQAGMDGATSDLTTPNNPERKKNLVVAGKENRFSDEIILYSLEMAKRMDFGIVAVNAADITHDVTEFFSTNTETIKRDFLETSMDNIALFREKALNENIPFQHVVKFSGVDEAIEEINREMGDIEFIVSQNRETSEASNVICDENRISQNLCVYAMC